MLRLWLYAVLMCGSVAAAHAAAIQNQNPTGRWLTENGQAVIQIAPCGADLCGQIVGIALAHPGDPMPTNWQGGPQCGMTILQTAPQMDSDTGATAWVGSVLDPRNGNVYHATIRLDDNRDLHLHGYLGLPIFGQTQIWALYAGRTLAGCKLAALG